MSNYKKVKLNLLECNIDDMNPELAPYIVEELFFAGAKDVWYQPIIMKFGRPAICLSVLCTDERQETMLDIVFRESSTLGVRKSVLERFELERRSEVIKCKYGEADLKLAYDNQGNLLNVAPEFKSCRELARQNSVGLASVYQEVLRAWNSKDQG